MASVHDGRVVVRLGLSASERLRPIRFKLAVVLDGLARSSEDLTPCAAGGRFVVFQRGNVVALVVVERSHVRSSTHHDLLGSARMDSTCSSWRYAQRPGVHGGRRFPRRSRFCSRATILSFPGSLRDACRSQPGCPGTRFVSMVPCPHAGAGAGVAEQTGPAEAGLRPARLSAGVRRLNG